MSPHPAENASSGGRASKMTVERCPPRQRSNDRDGAVSRQPAFGCGARTAVVQLPTGGWHLVIRNDRFWSHSGVALGVGKAGLESSPSRRAKLGDSKNKMGWLPPSLDGIAVCQSVILLSSRSREDGNEGYNDRGGPSIERFPASWRIDNRRGAVSWEIVAGAVSAFHEEPADCYSRHGSLRQCTPLGARIDDGWP